MVHTIPTCWIAFPRLKRWSNGSRVPGYVGRNHLLVLGQGEASMLRSFAGKLFRFESNLNKRERLKNKHKLALETLEDRLAPAAFNLNDVVVLRVGAGGAS